MERVRVTSNAFRAVRTSASAYHDDTQRAPTCARQSASSLRCAGSAGAGSKRFSIAIPPGYEAQVRPSKRPGNSRRRHVPQLAGEIDAAIGVKCTSF